MRDLTRGGLAGVVNEVAKDRTFGMQLSERLIPLAEATASACELLGLDALYLANEGKILVVVDGEWAERVVALLKNHSLGRDASVVGEVVPEPRGKAYLLTSIGTRRVVEMPFDDQLPRIC
jgi:hydrogenase expression/formation protein HypE